MIPKWLRLKNFTPKNIYYTIQGHYRSWIVSQYNKFYANPNTASKLVKYSNCVGNCKDCGCSLVELILSNKTCDECQV
jgi:hypothetical protein